MVTIAVHAAVAIAVPGGEVSATTGGVGQIGLAITLAILVRINTETLGRHVASSLEVALLGLEVALVLEALGNSLVLEIILRTRTKRRNVMRLPGDLGRSRNVSALLGGANGEDGALPSLALPGKLLVLGSLGADATRQVDVGEEAILLGDSHVDLLVLGLGLGLLLALDGLALGSVVVALVDIGSVLRVTLGLVLGSVGLLLDLVPESIKLVALVLDGLLNSLLKGRSKNLEHQGLEEAEEELVLGLLDLDVQTLDINVNLLNLEEVLGVLLVGGGDLHLEGETVSGKENVNDTGVSERREALLPLDVVADISEIHLDTGNLDLNGLVVLVGNLLAAPAEVVLAGNLADIGCEVVALKNQVLNDGIELRIGVLNARDGNVGRVLHDGWDDNLSQILDQVGLEDGLAVLVVAEIIEQLLAGLGKGVVLRVLVELVDEELDLVKNSVGVASVLVAEQVPAMVIEVIPLSGGGIVQNVALLKQAASDEGVRRLEPVLKLPIVISILVDLADRVPEILSGGSVSETLNQNAKVLLRRMKATSGLLGSAARLLGNLSTMSAILLSEAKEGLDGLRVIRVLLAFENHLLQAVNSLVLAILGHLLVPILLTTLAVLLVALKDVVLGLRVGIGVDLVLDDILGCVHAGIGVNALGALALVAQIALRVLEALDTLVLGLVLQSVEVLVAVSTSVDTGIGDIPSILLGVASVEALSLLLHVLLGEVGGIVPGIVISGPIHL